MSNNLLCYLAISLALKVEKKEGEAVDYTKLKVKQLKTILGKPYSSVLYDLRCNPIFVSTMTSA